jgi:predicted AlkP superfamily phosphohydrolase/phosphomutase
MPKSTGPVLMIEFNELTPALMTRFMAAGQLPNFERFYNESQVYTTDAEEEGENLNPWVQWVTIHSGLSAGEHGITRLSDGHRLKTKAVWDIVSDAGFKVWVCGSMNARYDEPLNGKLLPDAWSAGLSPYPKRLFESYHNFTRRAVQEHTNAQEKLLKQEVIKFLRFMIQHGLSSSTVRAILKQLWSELRNHDSWKRAVILDLLQLDMFSHFYRKDRPHFSTFFLNSTAHFQHCYWRNMEPEAFAVHDSSDQNARYKDAILYGYQCMDRLLGRLMRLVEPEATLIFCTALSQQPYLKAESTGGRHYYRIISQKVLRERFGISDRFEYTPVMAEQVILRFEEAGAARQAEQVLASYRLFDRPVLHMSLQGTDLMIQCNCSVVVPEDAVLKGAGAAQDVRFFEVFYPMNVVKSAYHHPDGMLWVRQPDRRHTIQEEKVSIRSIAPAILGLFDIPRSDSMMCDSFTCSDGVHV